MKLILRLLLSAAAVVLLSKILHPHVDVENYTVAIIVAVVLSLLKLYCQTHFGNPYPTHNHYYLWVIFIDYQCGDYSSGR